jgi:flagellar hook-basal body protein
MADVRISARSTLGSLNRWIEVISGNLVGSQIVGYKATRITFGDSLVDIIRGGSGNTGSLGGVNPVQIGSGGISVGGTTTDYRQGSLIQTGNNLDLSIQGNAFFTVADSSGKIIYTRAGEFSFDDAGYLVNKEGAFVLGLFDRTREIVREDQLADLNATGTGITMSFAGLDVNGADPNAGATATIGFTWASVFGQAAQTINKYLVDPAVRNQDRVVGETFVPAGQLISGTAQDTAEIGGTLGAAVANISGVTIYIKLPSILNVASRTSTDNARLIAKAINDQSDATGVGASVVVNLNDQTQATMVLGHVNRVLSESGARIPTNVGAGSSNVSDTLTTNETGLVKTFLDNKNNIFYAINSLTLFGKSPQYKPDPGDVYHFDSTGAIINDSKGKDPNSAPPFNTGIHVAVSKFANPQGLEKRRGGSQFTYTEATGGIQIGFAGMSRISQISTLTGLEVNGVSSVGVENVMISQALESSNSSVTDALPELTVAQKTFTSNTKVVNVGNTIVDDLNGLIR